MVPRKQWYDLEQFAHMAGFHDGLDILARSSEVQWTNTATDMGTGGMHALRYGVVYTGKHAVKLIFSIGCAGLTGALLSKKRKKTMIHDF